MDGRRDERVREDKAVISRGRFRLARQPGTIQSSVEPITTAIAGEHPTGSVGAMCRRRQADENDPGVWIAEAGDRPSPIILVRKGRPLLGGDPLPPLDEARTAPAVDKISMDDRKGVTHSGGGRCPASKIVLALHSIHPMSRSSATRWIASISSSGMNARCSHGR